MRIHMNSCEFMWIRCYTSHTMTHMISSSWRHHYVIITSLLRHHYVIITSLFRVNSCEYATILVIQWWPSLCHYYVIITSLLRHHYVINTSVFRVNSCEYATILVIQWLIWYDSFQIMLRHHYVMMLEWRHHYATIT